MTNSEEKHRASSEREDSVRRNTGTHRESHLKRDGDRGRLAQPRDA